ncbi:MAG: lipid-A-disaccharide synthase [Candidatus Omnitrophica bacterium]|nr:lipid-A-disaccharide synthase [Candidatus Omnitrophota bacterium]
MALINRILIVCGEASGDLHAAHLVRQLKALRPQLQVSAVGGARLAQEGAQIIFPIGELSVIGLFDVLRKLPRFFSLKKNILRMIASEHYDCLILVDFSGFNLRLARAVNRRLPVVYYVSPQVWASRTGRVKTIREYVSKICVLFRFEVDFYKKHGVRAEFFGHPLLDIVKPTMKKEEFLNNVKLPLSKTTLALLPGSRRAEVERILPVMLAAAELLKERFPVQAVIAKSEAVDWEIYKTLTKKCAVETRIIEGKTYDCLGAADFAMVASGTATLETAIMGTPFVLLYKMSLLNYLLYRPQVRVPYIGMVNIAAGRKIVPEFIQFGAGPRRIAREIAGIMQNAEELARMKEDLKGLKETLGEKGAGLRAAEAILRDLESRLPS